MRGVGGGGRRNSSSDVLGVMGRSELYELGLECALDVLAIDGVGDDAAARAETGVGGCGKLRAMSENVRRNESGESAMAATYAGVVGEAGGDGAGRGANRSVSSIENSYADSLASPFDSMAKSTKLTSDELLGLIEAATVRVWLVVGRRVEA